MAAVQKKPVITEILPKQGLVYSEKHALTEGLCKPKIMPIKSPSLIKMEKLAKEASKPKEDTSLANESYPPLAPYKSTTNEAEFSL